MGWSPKGPTSMMPALLMRMSRRPKVRDGLVDQLGGLVGIGEVAGEEQDVAGGGYVAGAQEFFASFLQLFLVARGEGEPDAGAAEAMGERETESAGAAGDDGDLAGAEARSAGSESIGKPRGGDGGEEGQGG